MSLPEPFIHPDNTENQTFWAENGDWWNADVVDGGTLDVRVYGREYQGDGSKLIRWVIDCAEEDLGSLETLLLGQAGLDASHPRSLSLRQATEMSQKGNGHGNGHAKKKEHGEGRGALGGNEDPIKSIKGMGENRASDLSSCLLGNATTCSADLSDTYPRDPA